MYPTLIKRSHHIHLNMEEKKTKNGEEHFANEDPTEFPHADMEDMAKQATKKFKSLNS